jgi:hypothetical protein
MGVSSIKTYKCSHLDITLICLYAPPPEFGMIGICSCFDAVEPAGGSMIFTTSSKQWSYPE